MTLEHDPRTGPEDSGTVTIASGDNDAPQTAYSIRSDALFKVTHVKVEYDDDGTNSGVDVELYDDADGTSAGNVSDQRDSFLNLDPDSVVTVDGNYRDFEEDVLVKTANGNQDGDVNVTVKGVLMTDLEDMTRLG